jgi:uncharacterized protein (TIGR03067 family)
MLCPLCGGTRKFGDKSCVRCFGTGVVPDEQAPWSSPSPRPPSRPPGKPASRDGAGGRSDGWGWGGNGGTRRPKPPAPKQRSSGGGALGLVGFLVFLALIGENGDDRPPSPSHLPSGWTNDPYTFDSPPVELPPDPVEAEMTALRGRWESTETDTMVRGWIRVPYRHTHAIDVVDGRVHTFLEFCERPGDPIRMTLSPVDTPVSFVLWNSGTDGPDTAAHGIYEISGNRLTVAAVFKDKPRPTGFAVAPGVTRFVYQRTDTLTGQPVDQATYACGIEAWNTWQRLKAYLTVTDRLHEQVASVMAARGDPDSTARVLSDAAFEIGKIRVPIAEIGSSTADVDVASYSAELVILLEAAAALYEEAGRYLDQGLWDSRLSWLTRWLRNEVEGQEPTPELRNTWESRLRELEAARAARRTRVTDLGSELPSTLSARHGRQF